MTPAEAIEVLQKRLVGEWVAVSGENVHVMLDDIGFANGGHD